MEEYIETFSCLKFSAMTKVAFVNSSIQDITLGPNSSSVIEVAYDGKLNTLLDSTQRACDVDECLLEDAETINALQIEQVSKTYFEDYTLPYQKLFQDLEVERQRKMEEALAFRQNQIAEFDRWQREDQTKWWYQRQQEIILGMKLQEEEMFEEMKEYDKDVYMEHQKLLNYYRELAETRQRNDEELQTRQRQKKELNLIIGKVQNIQSEFRNIYTEVLATLNTNSDRDELKSLLSQRKPELTTLSGNMEKLVAKCKAGLITADDEKESVELLTKLQTMKEILTDIIRTTKPTERKTEETTSNTHRSDPQNDDGETHQNGDIPRSVPKKFVHKTNLRLYSELQSFLHTYTTSYRNLLDDSTLKQFRFSCKMAVNTPVNSISAVNPRHLQDKYVRLHNLLSGKTVEVGNKRITARDHPHGIEFCMDLLAQKFILQCDLMISGNAEAAFYYAAIILALWIDFPVFGKLLLAHLHRQCPYLVPIYLQRLPDQSDEDYYKCLGYKYSDGVVEGQDKFLKRMTGIVRLYSAIMMAKPRRAQKSPHPHGMSQAWRWLASILNLEPRVDISATVLHTFLETTGHTMQTVYGKQFKKIISFILDNYMPALKVIDEGGPVTRLEVLLLTYRRSSYFETPSGMLPDNFW